MPVCLRPRAAAPALFDPQHPDHVASLAAASVLLPDHARAITPAEASAIERAREAWVRHGRMARIAALDFQLLEGVIEKLQNARAPA